MECDEPMLGVRHRSSDANLIRPETQVSAIGTIIDLHETNHLPRAEVSVASSQIESQNRRPLPPPIHAPLTRLK